MTDISVLVVDDSALMRNLISKIVESTPGLCVAGKAMNGSFALEKIPLLKPDVICLDIEMPVMNGIEFLKERKRLGIDIPVIVLSSIATEGAAVTMQCLELGASDFVTKPSGSVSNDINKVAERLSELLLSFGGNYAKRHNRASVSSDDIEAVVRSYRKNEEHHSEINRTDIGLQDKKTNGKIEKKPELSFLSRYSALKAAETGKPVVPLRESGRIDLIVIGISTGGPNALREVFSKISPEVSQPIIVVQHMPAGFTAEFARSLDNICPLEVKEASDGDILKSGRILIAPGNFHVYIEKKSLAYIVRLSDGPQRNGHRPSADVLFESAASLFQNHALGVIMTGMGRDGAAQLAEMRRQGAWTLGQDEESSIVYGMPKVAFEMGAVQKQVSLSNMADEISKLALAHR
jgi:two-component system chemotaxis response regulator CheB